jgi:hypothetical protein
MRSAAGGTPPALVRKQVDVQIGKPVSPLRWLRLVGALILSGSGLASAQTTPVTLPPSLIAPNYDRIFPGLAESIEAGADVARARGAAAIWYNPSGMALARRTQLNASSQGYQLTLLGGTGIRDAGVEVSNFRTLPSFIGIVFGEELIPWKKVRIGFAVTNPISWEQSIDVSVTPAVGRRTTYTAQSNFQNYQPTIAVAYAVDRSFRLGFALAFPHTSASSQTEFSTAVNSSSTTVGSIRTLALSGNTTHLLASLSTQWDPLPWLSLGAVLKTPGLRILGGGSLTYQAQLTQQGVTGPQQSTQVFLRDSDAVFDYRIPLEIDAGFAVRIGRAEFELDLRWHQASGTYLALASNTPVQVVTTTAGTAPVNTTSFFPPQIWGTLGILNAEIGGHYRLNDVVTLHAGFYIDRAPGDARSPILQLINLYGMRAGVSFTSQTISGSVGLGYEFGTSNRALVTDSGDTEQQTLTTSTISLLFAISYDF